MEKAITINCRSCDKTKCLYYRKYEITLGPEYPAGKGTSVFQVCVLCKHRLKSDFYTRLEVGE